MSEQAPPVGQVEEVLASILSRPEFQPPEPAPLWRALGAAWTWVWARIGDVLEWLAPGLASASPTGSVLGRVGLALLALVGIGVVVHVARLWAASLAGSRRRGMETTAAAPGAAPRTADDWERAARDAARDERWREAVVALYQAVIHRLALDGRVRLDPGKTPGDYRRELGADVGAGPLLDRFVRRWEPLAFGRRDPGPRAWDELRGLARALGSRA